MSSRRRQAPREPGPPPPPSQFQPGDSVAWFAETRGWRMDTYNIMVEGSRDVEYFRLVSEMYARAHTRTLLDNGLTVLAAGEGNEGGTPGIVKYFSALKQLIDNDLTADGRILFRAFAVLDDDTRGRLAHRILTGPMSHNMRDNYDVFLLRRDLPRTTREPEQLGRLIKGANQQWNQMPCVIEDLISRDLLELFVEENPDCLRRSPNLCENGHHFDFRPHAKAPLFRFVRDVASLDDVTRIVEALRSFRYYLGLDPDGDS